MRDETILLITAILCITILQAIAMCMLHIDGVLLSGTVATIVAVAFKRQELAERLGGVLYGNNTKRFSSCK
jgi:hypothetical protein